LCRVGEQLQHGGECDVDIEEYLQSYEKMLSEGLPQEEDLEGITVQPTPGFVVKTRDLNSGMKTFLNVTCNEHIEAPHVKSLVELEGEEGVRVPLSVGTPVEDFDKKLELCVTYDLIAAPSVLQECADSLQMRDSVVQLCIAAVAQKYKIELDSRYKVPKMRYKGSTVQYQRIRLKKNFQIQEMPSEQVPGAQRSVPVAQKRGDEGLPAPEFQVVYSRAVQQADFSPPCEGSEAEQANFFGLDLPCYQVNHFQENIRGTMGPTEVDDSCRDVGKETREILSGRICVVQVKLPKLDPKLAPWKQFGVEVSDECLRVTFPDMPRSRAVYAPLTLWWPQPFCSAQSAADWDPASASLTVSLPAEVKDSFVHEIMDAVF